MLDEDGQVIGVARKGSDTADKDPKKNKAYEVDKEGFSDSNPIEIDSPSINKGTVFSREEVAKMTQAEVDKRLAARLREIEEKTLPAALAKIQGLEMLKDRDVAEGVTDEEMELDNIGDRDLNVENEREYEEVDYESSQDLQDRVNKAFKGEDPNSKECCG